MCCAKFNLCRIFWVNLNSHCAHDNFTQLTKKINIYVITPSCTIWVLFLQSNVQSRYFVAAVDSGPISLPWMRWQSQADITGDQPISITIKRANLKYNGIFLAPVIHTDLLLADITSIPHNPILSRYLTCWDDFNFIRYISILNPTGQYLTMSMWST